MRVLALTLMLALLPIIARADISSGYDAWNQSVNDAPPWVGEAIHLSAGVLFAAGTDYFISDKYSQFQRVMTILSVTLVLAIGVESLDKNFYWGDVAGYVAGAGGYVICVKFINIEF